MNWLGIPAIIWWTAVLALLTALCLFGATRLKKTGSPDDRLDDYNALIENMNEAFLTIDNEARIKLANKICRDVLGYGPEELKGRPFYDLMAEGSREEIRSLVYDGLKNGRSWVRDVLIRHSDNGLRFIRISASFIVSGTGHIYRGVILAEDITSRKKVEEELILQKAYFQQLFENSPEGIAILDNEDRIINVNSGFEKMFRYTEDEVRGRYINDVIVPEHFAAQAVFFSESVVLRGESIQKESVRMRKDGSLVDVSILAYPILISDRQVGIYAIYSDITNRKLAEEQLKYLSLNDPLTGIYNRVYFEQEMARLESGRRNPVSIMVCDVDGLKLVNDTMGHKSGDTLLVIAANLIRDCFRPEDVLARIGGDEFAILLPESDSSAVGNARDRIEESVKRYNSANPQLPMSISIGMATSSGDTVDLASLFKEADNNMYREKLHRSRSARSAIVQTLMKALEARDYITEGHGERLIGLAEGLARALGLSERSMTDLRLLAQFHDIGKVGIPDRILFKKGPLTASEFKEMQRHCEIGHRIAQSAPDLAPIADWILKHHEWWNGHGYPLGLKGEDVPLECRILAICDAYDAMTNNRPYRRAMIPENALKELKRCAGSQFDPDLVNVFISEYKTSRQLS